MKPNESEWIDRNAMPLTVSLIERGRGKISIECEPEHGHGIVLETHHECRKSTGKTVAYEANPHFIHKMPVNNNH